MGWHLYARPSGLFHQLFNQFPFYFRYRDPDRLNRLYLAGQVKKSVKRCDEPAPLIQTPALSPKCLTNREKKKKSSLDFVRCVNEGWRTNRERWMSKGKVLSFNGVSEERLQWFVKKKKIKLEESVQRCESVCVCVWYLDLKHNELQWCSMSAAPDWKTLPQWTSCRIKLKQHSQWCQAQVQPS